MWRMRFWTGGVGHAVIKLGKKGCLIKSKNERLIVPAVPGVHCLDTTGAGDNFAAGFLSGLMKSSPFGNAVALQRNGCQMYCADGGYRLDPYCRLKDSVFDHLPVRHKGEAQLFIEPGGAVIIARHFQAEAGGPWILPEHPLEKFCSVSLPRQESSR